MTRIIRLVAWVGLLWLSSAPPVSADPIVVTAGFLTAPRFTPPPGSVSLVGTRGFSLEGRVSPGEGNVHPLNECDPCRPGSAFSVGGILSGAVFTGVATLDGSTYTDLSSVDSPSSLYFEFVGSTIAPAFQDAPTFITAPFSIRQGFFNLSFPAQSALVVGGGIATLLLRPEPDLFGVPNQWVVDSVRYDFANQTPVPEPATLAMVAGGLLAITRAVKRNRRPRATSA